MAKKPLIGSSAAAFVGLLEKCKSSDEASQLLLRVSDCLQFQESDVEEAIKKLSEHFQSEEESVVRVKILWLFCDIGLECPGANLNNLVDETIHLIKNETSHKVSGMLNILFRYILKKYFIASLKIYRSEFDITNFSAGHSPRHNNTLKTWQQAN